MNQELFEIGEGRIQLGLLEWRRGDFTDAERSARSGIESLQPFRASDEHARSLYITGIICLGNVYCDTDRYAEAIPYLEQGRVLCAAEKDADGIADCENNLGRCYYFFVTSPMEERARWLLAKRHIQTALRIYESTNNDGGLASALLNLGMVTDELGNHQRALALYAKARIHAVMAGDIRKQALTWYHEGIVFNKLNRRKDALQSLQAALSTFQEQGSKREIAWASAEVGMLYLAAANELGEYLRNTAAAEMALRYLVAADETFIDAGLSPLRKQHTDFAQALDDLSSFLGETQFDKVRSEEVRARKPDNRSRLQRVAQERKAAHIR